MDQLARRRVYAVGNPAARAVESSARAAFNVLWTPVKATQYPQRRL